MRRPNGTPTCATEPLLIDATYAGLLTGRGGRAARDPEPEPRRRPASPISSCRSYGSIAGAESVLLSPWTRTCASGCAMSEAPHGTAPALEGKDIANPMGMILAAAAGPPLRRRGGRQGAERWPRGPSTDAVMETAASGIRTPDLKGHARHDRVHRCGDRAGARSDDRA